MYLWCYFSGVGVGMLIAFIWIILMRWIAGPIVWITIILFLAIFGFGKTSEFSYHSETNYYRSYPLDFRSKWRYLHTYTWSVMLQCLLLIVTATYYCFDKYFDMKDNPANQGDFQFTTNLDYYWNLANTWLALGKSRICLYTQVDGIYPLNHKYTSLQC